MSNQPGTSRFLWLPWLDVLAIVAWGILLLKYWLVGKLNLLIHPDYQWLVIGTGIGFLGIGISQSWTLINQMRFSLEQIARPSVQHFTFLPPGWSSILLLITALLGMFISPQAFNSQTAIQRGVTELVTMTRSQNQSFWQSKRPEDRSLVEWVRTLTVYPDPDKYAGQKVKVQGFVIHPPQLPENYLLISRFVITCCAADAYPVGLPVKLQQSRTNFPADTWLEIVGQMIAEKLDNKSQLVIQATSVTPIKQPENPYDY